MRGIVERSRDGESRVLLSQPGNIRLAAKRGKRSSFSLFLESLTLCGEGEEKGKQAAVYLVPSGLCRISVPKGLKDSARGFNPGNTSTQRPALKGRKRISSTRIVRRMSRRVFGQVFSFSLVAIQASDSNSRLAATTFCPFRAGRFLHRYPGVKTPG